MKELKDSGFLALLVGGCIRDLLLKRPIKDWDIVTDAKPQQIKMIFNKFKTIMIGKSFQTVTIVLNYQIYQISTLRKNKNKKFTNYYSSLLQLLNEDLLRRDFTINSMAWDQDKGLLDPTNGYSDLNNKVLQSVKPDIRMKEDPLRTLRAIRFTCELNFILSPEVKSSLCRNAYLIRDVSSERIRDEICLILNSPDPKRGILLLKKFNLEHYIFSLDRIKKMQSSKKKTKKIALSGLNELQQDLAAQLALWGRMSFDSCQAARMLYFPVIKYLRFKKKTNERVKIFLSTEWQDIDFSSGKKIRFLIARFGKENTKILIRLKRILLCTGNALQKNQLKIEEKVYEEELAKNNVTKLSELAINGQDLKEIGYQEGKEIGRILNYILTKVLVQPELNDREKLLDLAKSIDMHINHKKNFFEMNK